MKASKHFIPCILLSALISSTLMGCGSSEASSDAVSSEQPSITTSVETQTLSEGLIQEYKTISSNILPQSEVAVIPKVGGTVSKVYVKVGDEVKAGDLLFEIDSTDLQLQVKSAQNSVDSAQVSVSSAQNSVSSAQAGLNSAQASYEMNTGSAIDKQISSQKANIENLERQYNDLVNDLETNKSLLEIGAVSQDVVNALDLQVATAKTNLDQAKEQLKTLEEKTVAETKRVSEASIKQAEASVKQAQTSVSQAEASVRQSQTSLESAQRQLSYTQVKAEIDGVISTCNVTEGSTVSAGASPLSIIDIDSVKISFNVTGDMINRIHVGNAVNTFIDAVSNEPFNSVISTVSPAATGMSGLYPVEINIDNPEHLLKPGMFATSQIILSENTKAISVPINAVIDKNDEKYVFTVDANNIAHKVVVETGIENDSYIELTSGVNVNDIVVIKGQDYLSDGSLVSIVTSNE